MRIRVLCVAIGVSGAACGSESSDPGPADVCAAQSVHDDGTVLCTQGFAAAPYVHLPDDTATEVYVGLAGGRAQSRAAEYTVDSALLDPETMFSALRYGHMIYRATVSGQAVTALEPYVEIDDRVLLAPLGGLVLEGAMTPRDPSNATEPFDPQTLTADVRIELDGAPGDTQIDTNGGYPRYALEGTIVNLDANVTGSDGTCMPSLTSLADANPLDTSRGDRIRIMRVPSMHGAFDDVFTLDWPEDQYTNDMGSALFISTIALASPLPAWNPVQGSPHGTPWSGPSFDTAVVTGGGADCSL